MLKDYIWKAFEYTGNIDAYILYKEMENNKIGIDEMLVADKEVAVGG